MAGINDIDNPRVNGERIGPLLPRRFTHAAGPPDNEVAVRTGALLFADISGFTKLTEKLGLLGREGAEELTVGINSFFEKLLSVIHNFNGDVLKFGGDALLVGFAEHSTPEQAVQCSFQLLRVAERAGQLRTGAGRFRLGLHVGVSFDQYYETLSGAPGKRREHFLFGRAVHRCQQAADLAGTGEIVAAIPAARRRQFSFAHPQQRSPGFYQLSLTPADVSAKSPVNRPPAGAAAWWADLLDPRVSDQVRTRHADWIGEHRAASVAFVFFKGSDSWKPDVATAAFAQVHDAVLNSIDRWDAVWARSDPGSAYQKLLFFFGAPTAGENDPLRAVGFGLEVQERLAAIARDGLQLDFSIGLATGRVFGGFVGGKDRREYTVMGDAINLAARLASRSFGGLLTIDQATAQAAGDRYQIKKLKPARLKGKTGLIPQFRPTGTRNEAITSIHHAGVEYYPEQFTSISRLIQDLKNDEGCGICILGEAGCGKSTLARRVVRESALSTTQAIHSTIWPEEKSIAFSGVARLLSDVFRGKTDDQRKYREILQESWPARIDPRWQSLFAEILGFSSRPTALVRGLSRQARLEKLGELLPDLITAIAGPSCRTIVLENYQWLDPTSKTALQFWWKNIARYSFVVLITGRKTDEFADNPELHLTTLGPVDKTGLQRLIESRFPEAEPPKSLIAELAARSRLVPAVADAYLDYWIEGGQLYRDPRNPRRIHVGNLKATDLPDALLAAHVRRLDTLTPLQRDIIHAVAIWGGEITVSQLARMVSPRPPKNALVAAVTELARLDCLNSGGTPHHPTFSITHPLLGQAAYQTMSFATRRDGHGLAATMWEKRRGRGVAAKLARHYLAAGDSAAALPTLRAAAEDSAKMGANQEARHFLVEAGRLADKQPDQRLRLDVCLEWADVEQELGNYDAARRLFSRAGRLAKQLDCREHVLLVQLSLGRLYWISGKYDRCEQTVTEILNAQAIRKNRTLAGRARLLSGELLRRRGQFEKAEILLRLAQEDFRAIGDKTGLLEVFNTLGIVCWAQGKLNDAAAFFRAALKLGGTVVDLASRARLSNNLGILFEEQAHLKRARLYYARAFDIFSEIGNRRNRAYCLGNLANIDRHTGRFDSAREGYEEVLRETTAIGEAHAHAYTLGNLGDLYADFGDFNRAAPYYRRTLAFARRADDDELKAETLLRMASLARHKGKSGLCAQHIADAARLAQQAGSEEFQIKAALMADTYPPQGEKPSITIARLHETLQRAVRARLILYEILAHEALARLLNEVEDKRHALRHALQGLGKARKAGFALCEVRLYLLAATARTEATWKGRAIQRVPQAARKHLEQAGKKITEILQSISDAPLRGRYAAYSGINRFPGVEAYLQMPK